MTLRVLMAVNLNIKIFQCVTPCTLVDRYQFSWGVICLRIHCRTVILDMDTTVSSEILAPSTKIYGVTFRKIAVLISHKI